MDNFKEVHKHSFSYTGSEKGRHMVETNIKHMKKYINNIYKPNITPPPIHIPSVANKSCLWFLFVKHMFDDFL